MQVSQSVSQFVILLMCCQLIGLGGQSVLCLVSEVTFFGIVSLTLMEL